MRIDPKKHNAVVRKRAHKAAEILAKYYDGEDLETSMMDCLADLLHLASVKEADFHYDFAENLRRAGEHEKAERLGIE